MSAPPSRERHRLLALVADHILQRGVNDLSLSSLARAVGSNNRMLLYYFGSKEELLDEASLVALERFPGIDHLMGELDDDGPPGPLLERAWLRIADRRNRPFLRLFFELFSLHTWHPDRNAGYFRRIATQWPEGVARLLVREGYDETTAQECAVAIVALWRGLQISLLAGADPEDLRAAHRRSLASILGLQTIS
ncbi:TetR/AcrR family transcriptional regulator [Nakamurella leprariae]|uniref:TetR/AcrR family transcriptional regulator n=1 Tax=Nakamurella leprariae TaxID=2803911 RepID=A0A938YK03_9ACTN|nr:TetR/AcrR family transcriptional regulator [Nakamurella leprariae]MBM9469574.1 TetR/AcrR family transcriptional regulator [Nakamurella leprariae]